jgi:hypothetical protein
MSTDQLMEQRDYNLLFRWFFGLSADDPVWAGVAATAAPLGARAQTHPSRP